MQCASTRQLLSDGFKLANVQKADRGDIGGAKWWTVGIPRKLRVVCLWQSTMAWLMVSDVSCIDPVVCHTRSHRV
jgi:hypothetical protein